jgi:parallel beta-helix repeat protein
VLTVADCTDFAIINFTIDGNRQQYPNGSITSGANGPVDQFLTVNAASGQPSFTVQDGSKYFVGQRLFVCGGLTANGGTEIDFTDQHRTIVAVNGNVITIDANLSHTYTAAVNNGGAYVTTYQTGIATVAGRALADEDMQNGVHLINCQRFRVSNNSIRNIWESPIRLGTFNVPATGCSFGTISGNNCRTGYDQGIALWQSDHITVSGNTATDTGWAGVSCTYSWNCTITGNVLDNIAYRLPGDNKSGSGIVCEGGAGHSIVGNIISQAYSRGITLSRTPINAGINTSLTSATAIGATGSIAVGSSANFNVGARYAIYDGSRSEHITVTSIVDGTHISIGTAKMKAWHPSGALVGASFPMDIVINGNVIDGIIAGNGLNLDASARIAITNNIIRGSNQQGINLHSADGTPSGAASAILISGNQLTNNVTAGGAEQLLVDSLSGISIIGNRFTGYPAASTKDIHCKGVTDSIIQGNYCSDSANTPIVIENGAGTSKRITVSNNNVIRAQAEGILILAGDGLIITGNHVYSCNSTGIDIRAVTHCIVHGNTVISNKNAGIKLQDNGTPCTYNRIEDNVVREDGSGSWQGSTFTQGAGIVESGTGNNNIIANNTVSTASTKVGAATTITGEIVH